MRARWGRAREVSMFDGRDGEQTSQRHGANDEGDWRHVDARLRQIAVRRAGLDAEEARWLLAARRSGVHRQLGFASALEYMERVLGYGPRAASERLRVAEALESLPRMRDALSTGQLAYSAVRELSRVATADTEAEWIAKAQGRTLREIEPMVAGLRPGDEPGARPDVERLRHRVHFEVSSATLALLRDARRALEEQLEGDDRLDDDALVAALCRGVLGAPPDGQATYQVAVTVCERCERGWQDGAGATVEISPEDVDRAQCDAQHIGSVDAATPARATQDIPPAVRRLVHRRDHGRCVVPGCRNSRHVEIHHLVHRAHGGSHSPDNLVLACTAHHMALHEGRLIVTGTVSTGLSFAHVDGRPYGAPPLHSRDERPRVSTCADDAISALRNLGFTAAQSRAAVAETLVHLDADASFDTVVGRALAACRRIV